MISETFLADSDDDAVAHLDQGPFVDGVTEAVAVGELTALEFDALQSVLTGESFRDVLESGEGGLLQVASDTGPWVSRIRPRLTEALAGVEQAQIAGIVARWAQRDEVEDVPARTLAVILAPLADLARTALQRGQHMYLWNTL